MILEKVRILVKVDRLERELPQAFSAVCVCGGLRCDTTAAEFRAGSILVIHGSTSLCFGGPPSFLMYRTFSIKRAEPGGAGWLARKLLLMSPLAVSSALKPPLVTFHCVSSTFASSCSIPPTSLQYHPSRPA